MDTVFPRLERARSNFIVLPRGGLYEVRVVIRGAFCQGHASMCIQPVLSNWPALFFSASPGHARGSPLSNVDQPIVYYGHSKPICL